MGGISNKPVVLYADNRHWDTNSLPWDTGRGFTVGQGIFFNEIERNGLFTNSN
jgi:hypothetical protein